jgi:protein dithiol oxidoreductase (disulfide-forming)
VRSIAALLLAASFVIFGSHRTEAQSPAPAAAPEGTAASRFQAGRHYQRLSPAQPTSSETGKIEVAEVFMFSCPGCYGFEPHLQSWIQKQPADVSFVRIPAPWNAVADLHAHAYYVAEALGKAREIEGPFFNEFHAKKNYLDSEDKLASFFEQFGVDETTFRNTFKSFAVDAKVTRAGDLVKRYKVPSTPAVIVNGKYLTSGTMAGSYADWFAIIDELIATERAAGKQAN